MAPTTEHLTEAPVSVEIDTVVRLLEREPWMAQAACTGRTQLFFGLAGERPERRVRREARARKVCAQCPVLESCRGMARRNGENGYWGGETEEERAAAGYPPVSISRRSVEQAAVTGMRRRPAHEQSESWAS
jgi:WhiB family redox-sensing transcriptional regulator